MKKVLLTGTPTTRRRPHGMVPAREIAVRCLCFGGLVVFVVVFWLGAVSLVQIVRLIMRPGPL